MGRVAVERKRETCLRPAEGIFIDRLVRLSVMNAACSEGMSRGIQETG